MMVITSSGQSDLFIWLGRGREGCFIWLRADGRLNNPTVPCFPGATHTHTHREHYGILPRFILFTGKSPPVTLIWRPHRHDIRPSAFCPLPLPVNLCLASCSRHRTHRDKPVCLHFEPPPSFLFLPQCVSIITVGSVLFYAK